MRKCVYPVLDYQRLLTASGLGSWPCSPTEGVVRKCVYPVLDYERLLTPAEMAAAWGVSGKTLYIWARAGKIRSIVTPGGISRYPASELPPAFALETGEPPP